MTRRPPPIPTRPPPLPVIDDEPPTKVYEGRSPEPMRAISMKTPAELAAERVQAVAAPPQRPQHVAPPKVQIRSIGSVAEAARRAHTTTPAHGLGTIAPPRDPRQARERKLWSLVFWGSIVVIIASLVALAVWLIAR